MCVLQRTNNVDGERSSETYQAAAGQSLVFRRKSPQINQEVTAGINATQAEGGRSSTWTNNSQIFVGRINNNNNNGLKQNDESFNF